MMIVQSAALTLKHRNQPGRECLYAWYPEVIADPGSPSTAPGPREIYIHKGLDRTLLQDNSPANQLINEEYSSNSNTDEVLQRYKQSVAPSERVYHSSETIDEALKTPWALHYDVERRPATPNLPSHSTDLPIRDEAPRRLKSAPLLRSLPPTSILTVPEPQFITPIIPITTTTAAPPRARASSAKARLNSTLPANYEYAEDNFRQARREIKSAIETRPKEENMQRFAAQVYADKLQQEIPSVPAVSSSNVDSWAGSQSSIVSVNEKKPPRPQHQATSLTPNIHYIHRPGVIAVRNSEKKPLIRSSTPSKRASRHHRRSAHVEQRHEPLLALTPIPQSRRFPMEIDGIKLIYDPNLTLHDPSPNLTKYFIDGSLYLIKDQRYNVLENIDPSLLDKYQQSQNQSLPQRPKYYQTIPLEKFQIPKPVADVHYNASETYFYNTIPKRVHRYVIDPNFISENLNVNKMSLSKRPLTANAMHSASRDTHRSSSTRPIYA